MKTQSVAWSPDRGLEIAERFDAAADLVVYFGPNALLSDAAMFDALRAAYPRARLFGCSTGGQMAGSDIVEDRVSAVAIRFEHARIRAAEAKTGAGQSSRAIGKALAAQLDGPELAGIMVLSDGLSVNGSALAAGLLEHVGPGVPICGGLAGDGAAFRETLVGLDGPPRANVVAAIGFYGAAVHIGFGSGGGWDVFGPSRSITRSVGNVLYELDGQPALDLYERYLGPADIEALPGSALRFPLLVRNPDHEEQELVRTVLAIDRDARTMTFAGDIPRGWSAQLMRSTFDRLADGAASAASAAARALDPEAVGDGGSVGFLISCIGRRLMMGQHVVEEIEAAAANLPAGMATLGFYSYGEISPHAVTGVCELHNQTMTIMTITERAA